MTDEELLNGLRSEMLTLPDAERGGDETFVESIHQQALAYLNNPPADLYHRYMEIASVMRAGGRDEFAGLVERHREAAEQQRRVWIAWLVAAYEKEMARLGDLNEFGPC
jgi:hypothetical protein